MKRALKYLALPLLPPPRCDDDRLVTFRYSMEFAMPKPRTFIGIDWGFDDRRTGRQRWRDLMAMSERWKARRQRRLDYRSSVRRRKRWEELRQRKEVP